MLVRNSRQNLPAGSVNDLKYVFESFVATVVRIGDITLTDRIEFSKQAHLRLIFIPVVKPQDVTEVFAVHRKDDIEGLEIGAAEPAGTLPIE
jgi:hypothetical protein